MVDLFSIDSKLSNSPFPFYRYWIDLIVVRARGLGI